MGSADGDDFEAVDRFRAAFDKAQGVPDGITEPYERTVTGMLTELTELGRIAWAALNPARPISPEILMDIGDDALEALHDLLPELRRFGQAMLTKGDPSLLTELTGACEGEREEGRLIHEMIRAGVSEREIETARRWAKIFQLRLKLLDPNERRVVFAEFRAALDDK